MKRGLLQDDDQPMLVTYADHSKLSAMMGAVAEKKGSAEGVGAGGVKRRMEQDPGVPASTPGATPSSSASLELLKEPPKKSRKQASDLDLEIESLLSQQSTKEQQSKKVGGGVRETGLALCTLQVPSRDTEQNQNHHIFCGGQMQ